MNTETRFFEHIGVKKVCEICGNPIGKLDRTKPSKYCSDYCSNYSKYKSQLENALIHIKPIPSHISIIRGDMFRLANLLSNGTKSLKVNI